MNNLLLCLQSKGYKNNSEWKNKKVLQKKKNDINCVIECRKIYGGEETSKKYDYLVQ